MITPNLKSTPKSTHSKLISEIIRTYPELTRYDELCCLLKNNWQGDMTKQHYTLLTGSQVKVIYKCYFSLSQQVKTLERNHIQEHGSLPIVLPSEVTVHKKTIKKCMEHSYNFMIYIKHLIFVHFSSLVHLKKTFY